jgi:hypothetical protein
MVANNFEEYSNLYQTKYIPKIYEAANYFVSSLSPGERRAILLKLKKVEEDIAAIHRPEMPTERKKEEMFNYIQVFNHHEIKVL